MARCRSFEIWAALELCSNRSEGEATVNRSHTVQLHNDEIEWPMSFRVVSETVRSVESVSQRAPR